MDTTTFFRETLDAFVARVNAVRPDQWADPTPCAEWNVRSLVNHVVYEHAWVVPLLDGLTVAEVGSKLDGDLVGDDPVGGAVRVAGAALDAVDAAVPAGGTVDTSMGPISMDEYVRQIAVENLVHGWDLAAATGGDRSLPEGFVSEAGAWFTDDKEAEYRASGGIAPRRALTGDPTADLLARFGRDASWQP